MKLLQKVEMLGAPKLCSSFESSPLRSIFLAGIFSDTEVWNVKYLEIDFGPLLEARTLVKTICLLKSSQNLFLFHLFSNA